MQPSLLEQLYHSYATELSLYLYSLCKNREATEDLLHEVFLKALLSLDDHHGNFRAWLYTVGRNLCLNYLRAAVRTVPLDGMPEQGSDSLWTHVLRRERERALYQAMLSLPEKSRQILILQYFSGLPQGEIAQVMGLSPGNLRIIVHRAKKELKRKLEESGYGCQ